MIPPEPGLTWRKSSYSGSNGGCVEVAWRKSTHSADNGGCVEVGWRKSSYSGDNGACVEVAPCAHTVAVRDSKHPTGPTLAFPTPHWHTFLPTH
jgi:hypothetical protein